MNTPMRGLLRSLLCLLASMRCAAGPQACNISQFFLLGSPFGATCDTESYPSSSFNKPVAGSFTEEECAAVCLNTTSCSGFEAGSTQENANCIIWLNGACTNHSAPGFTPTTYWAPTCVRISNGVSAPPPPAPPPPDSCSIFTQWDSVDITEHAARTSLPSPDRLGPGADANSCCAACVLRGEACAGFVFFQGWCYYKSQDYSFRSGAGRTAYFRERSTRSSPPPALPPPSPLLPPSLPPTCPWKEGTSGKNYGTLCADMSYCSTITGTQLPSLCSLNFAVSLRYLTFLTLLTDDYDCCECRGGAIKCPDNLPNMCTETRTVRATGFQPRP